MPMLQPVEHSESGSGPIFLLGNELGQVRPRVPFDAQVLGLLAELSARLRKHAEARSMPDVQTFAFWCRKANLQKLKAAHDDHKARLGLGLVFHVAPGNVPINFAFSLAFGLLAGNTNVVRVPSRLPPAATGPASPSSLICGMLGRRGLRGEPGRGEPLGE